MKKSLSLVACAFLAGASLLFYSFNFKDDTLVRIAPGMISGVKSGASDVIAYKGIPFAAPPVGELRWKAPQPVAAWTGIKKCDAFGPSPMQGKPVPFMVYTAEFLIPEKPISEDCLYLNVWAKPKAAKKKPVFVWIYGGGFSSGGTAVPIYDGEALAKKGIVFVSVNYRVGVFGFLAHPELTKEAPYHASGNYGLLDQVAALQWVKKNIAAFGGDPNNVTIAGQSAGSMSVNTLVASPLAKGLFHKAIAESGSRLVSTLRLSDPLSAAEQQGIKLQESLHVGSLAEMRKLSAEDIMKVRGGYSPIVDGYLLPEPVSAIFAAGKQNDVPVITGWNADEALIGAFKNKDAYQQQMKEQYGADAETVLKYYPGNTDDEARLSQIKMSRDMTFALSGFKWANLQSEKRRSPIYVYNFVRKLPATPDFVKYGAFHTGEVAYVMDDLKFLNRPWEPEDQPLATLMSEYWVNFMTKGDPNGKGLPEWPKYNITTYPVMVFDKTSGQQPLADKDGLKFMLTKVDK